MEGGAATPVATPVHMVAEAQSSPVIFVKVAGSVTTDQVPPPSLVPSGVAVPPA